MSSMSVIMIVVAMVMAVRERAAEAEDHAERQQDDA
jgi:hypothetical protein